MKTNWFILQKLNSRIKETFFLKLKILHASRDLFKFINISLKVTLNETRLIPKGN